MSGIRSNKGSAGREAAGRGEGPRGGGFAALLYGGVAFIAAAVFWAVTTFAGSYPGVARYAGSAWVFILVTIVLMPLVIPRVAKRRSVQPREEREPTEVSCDLPVRSPEE